MAKNLGGDSREALPACAIEYIRLVKKKMRYRRRARAEVVAELTAHFEDALRDCTDAEQRDAQARALIDQFGDARLLAVLCRRAKKRCRPLWQKALARSLGGVGIVVLYFLLCLGRFFVGTPSVKVDYGTWFSEQVKHGRDESLNAKPYVDEAAKLAGQEPYVYQLLGDDHARWPGDMNDVQRQAVVTLLEKDAAAYEVLSRGVAKPYYWTDYRPGAAGAAGPSTDNLASSGSPQMLGRSRSALMAGSLFIPGAYDAVSATLPDYRRLAQGLALRACWRAWQEDVAGACADCLSLQRMGWHLEGQGLVVEQLVGVAIEGLAEFTIRRILSRTDVPADLLQHVQEELQTQLPKRETVVTLTSERIFWYDYIQRTFTDDGKGGGRPLRGAMPLVVGGWKDGLRGVVTFSCPGRQETMRMVNAFYDEIELTLKEMPWQAGRGDKADRLRVVAADSFLLGLMADSQARLTNLVWRRKLGREALVTTLAVLRHKKDESVYPDNLDVLIATGYLSKMPIDPYSGQPFGYRKTTDGFLLYSWGENLTDDGGRRGTGRDVKPREWAPNGDWVFWPLMRITD